MPGRYESGPGLLPQADDDLLAPGGRSYTNLDSQVSESFATTGTEARNLAAVEILAGRSVFVSVFLTSHGEAPPLPLTDGRAFAQISFMATRVGAGAVSLFNLAGPIAVPAPIGLFGTPAGFVALVAANLVVPTLTSFAVRVSHTVGTLVRWSVRVTLSGAQMR